jgi:surfactin synthase thioesterase subunit
MSRHATPLGTNSRWLKTFTPRPDARLRLICFHPAGAGPNFYRSWAVLLSQDIEVCVVHLPGRESRFVEDPLTDYPTAVADLYAALRPVLDRPYALFGHSMGALLAHGVATTAARLGAPAPARLLLSGAGGPGCEPSKAGRGGWTDDELVADLREMGGTPEGVLADPELLGLILPVLRADYALCDSFHAGPPAGPTLTCPLTLLSGENDHYSPADVALWAPTTTGPTTQHLYAGGHFFLAHESAEAVLATVAQELGTRRPEAG